MGLRDFRCYLHVAEFGTSPCVSVLFWLISIARYVLSLQVFAFEGQNMTFTVNVLNLHSKL